MTAMMLKMTPPTIVPLNDRESCIEEAAGMMMSAEIRSDPTILIDMTTVNATTTLNTRDICPPRPQRLRVAHAQPDLLRKPF